MKATSEYLSAIGGAHYAWASMEWNIICILTKHDRVPVKDLAGLEFGKIIERFAATVATHPGRSDVATAAEALRLRRNDLAHARPAKIDGEEMLYRWDAKRGRIEPITHSWLKSFTSDVRETGHAANHLLHETT